MKADGHYNLDVGFEFPVIKKLFCTGKTCPDSLQELCAWKINLQIAADVGLIMVVSVGSLGGVMQLEGTG